MGNPLSAAYSAMPLRGVIPMPPARKTADRVFEVRARGTRRERHGARVHALLGLQLEERELSGTEREARRFLRLDRTRARGERSRGHDPSPKAPRGTGQRLDLQMCLGAPEHDCGIS